MQEFRLEHAGIWFVRFSLDAACTLMACGNMASQVFLFDMLAPSETAGKAKLKLRASKDKANKEEVTVSPSDLTCNQAG